MGFRYIHDDVPHSRTLSRLSSDGERLYWRILSISDPWGRVAGDLQKLRLAAIPSFPWDDDRLHSAVDELVRAGAIDRYSEAGGWAIEIVNFEERQPVAKMKRAPSRFPARTPSSLSHDDLTLSLPLLDERPEACAETTLPLPSAEPEACDLGLSTSDLRSTASEKPLQKPRSSDRDREDRRENVLPTAVVQHAADGLSVAQTIEASLRVGARGLVTDDGAPSSVVPEDVASVASQLRDADPGTVNVLADLRRKGLPPAAFANALESLRDRRSRSDRPPLKSDVRYVVGALKTMLREGTYAT